MNMTLNNIYDMKSSDITCHIIHRITCHVILCVKISYLTFLNVMTCHTIFHSKYLSFTIPIS